MRKRDFEELAKDWAIERGYLKLENMELSKKPTYVILSDDQVYVIGEWAVKLARKTGISVHNLDQLMGLLDDLRRRGWLSPNDAIAWAEKFGYVKKEEGLA